MIHINYILYERLLTFLADFDRAEYRIGIMRLIEVT